MSSACCCRIAPPIARRRSPTILRQAIREYRFEWQDGAMNVGVSIGIVEINSASESIGSVMAAADVACYAAKDSGRNRVHMYQSGSAPERHREMQWVSRLTRACEENRLELYYQPIVPIGATRDTRGHYELLLRMRGEHGELVQPAEFQRWILRGQATPTGVLCRSSILRSTQSLWGVACQIFSRAGAQNTAPRLPVDNQERLIVALGRRQGSRCKPRISAIVWHLLQRLVHHLPNVPCLLLGDGSCGDVRAMSD